jgi:hypothetical protein
MDFIDLIVSEPSSTIFGSILAVAGIIASFVAYKMATVRVEPRVFYENIVNVLVRFNKSNDIKVWYRQQPITQLTTTRIWFWNSGRLPIKSADIPSVRPFEIDFARLSELESKDPIFFDAKVVKVSDSACGCTVVKSSNQTKFQLKFDYLDTKQGAVIDIVHNGGSNTKINVMGTILVPKKKTRIFTGMSSGVGQISRKSRRAFIRISAALSLAMAIIIGASGYMVYRFIPVDIYSNHQEELVKVPKDAISKILTEYGVQPDTALVAAQDIESKFSANARKGIAQIVVVVLIVSAVSYIFTTVKSMHDQRTPYPSHLEVD